MNSRKTLMPLFRVRAASIRTPARLSPEAKVVIRMIAAFGPTAADTASLLVRFSFDTTRVALMIGLRDGCPGCSSTRTGEALRGCDRHTALVRQRIHRLQERLLGILGLLCPTSRRRRPVVHFGADRLPLGSRSGGAGLRLYDLARAPGAEGEEL
jgi:hypothetical protein